MTSINRSRAGVSTALAVVLLIVGLGVGAGIGYATTVVSTSVQSSLPSTVNIGVLDDLTDGLSGEGIKINYTVHQAVNDINAYLQNTSFAGKVKFNVIVEDYALVDATAEADMNTFKSDGVSVVVGPLNSGTASALLTNYADADQIVMISPSSTSAALAIPNDYLFRTAPTDVHQGAADAAILYSDGVRNLIQVYRQDTYGSGLANYTKADFKAMGGNVIDSISYPMDLTSGFSTVLSALNTDWTSNVKSQTANATTAIQLISFDEGAELILEASHSYPNLLKTAQPWYGVDGEEGETVFTNSTNVAAVQAVRLPSTVFGFTNSSKTQALCANLLAATHLTCDSYPLGAYDDMWIAALSLLSCGKNSGSCVQSRLTSVADNYYGVTGWTALDANGDRAVSDFLIYCISGSPLTWNVCGSWSYQTNTVTWTHQPTIY